MSKDYGPLQGYLKSRVPEPKAEDPSGQDPVSEHATAFSGFPSSSTQTSVGVNHGQRTNPRTGALLAKKVIPGTSIEIDYDPQTGGVFLDSGELENLSKVPDIKAKLEMLLSP